MRVRRYRPGDPSVPSRTPNQHWPAECADTHSMIRALKPARTREPACPTCGEHALIPILYGEPHQGAIDDAAAGLVKLGGCSVTDSDPEWWCANCHVGV